LGCREFKKTPKLNLIQVYCSNIREYENKLIESVLNSKGVTLKPTELQLKDFIKRLKSLDKDTVCDILNEKLMKFNEMEDTEQVRMLLVCVS
jgi:hypothetical protein